MKLKNKTNQEKKKIAIKRKKTKYCIIIKWNRDEIKK